MVVTTVRNETLAVMYVCNVRVLLIPIIHNTTKLMRVEERKYLFYFRNVAR